MSRASVLLLLLASLVGCIEDEKTRPYAEFVEDYERLLDMAPGQGGGRDVGTDLASREQDMLLADEGISDQGGFTLDPDNPPECSLQGGPARTVTFVNGLDNAIDLYWIRFDCIPVKYVTIEAGGSYEQPTFAGHVWDYSAPFGTPVNRRVVVFEETTTITLGGD